MAKFAPLMPMSASQYFLPHDPPGDHRQIFRIIRRLGTQPVMEQIADLLPRQVHGREDDVIRRFVAKLHDEFAQIGFHHLKTSLLQRVVEMDFLRRHALGFDDGTDLVLPRHADNIIPRRLCIGRPEYPGAARFEPGRKLIQITVEVIDGFPFDGGGHVARARPVLESGF